MCAACGGKAGQRKVTAALGDKIRRWAQPSWSPDVLSHPSGICELCRKTVGFCDQQQTSDIPSCDGTVQKWRKFKIENISVLRGQMAASCTCPICTGRKSNPVVEGKKGLNNWIKEKKQIQTENKEEEIKERESEQNKSCPKCFQEKIGPGINHKCNEANRKKNLVDIVVKDKGSEQILSKVLKEVIQEKGASTSEEVTLKQIKGGKDLTVTLGKRKVEKESVVDAEVTAKVKKTLDLSKRQTRELLKILRKGNVKVEKNVMGILEEISSTLVEEYEDIKMEFDVKEEDEDEDDKRKEKKKKCKRKLVKAQVDVTIAKDAKQLIEKVVEARDLDINNVKCRTVIDGGQGSLKIVTSVFQGDIDELTQEGNSEKLTGSNRLIILAEVEGGLETHSNIHQLLERLQLDRLPGLVMVGDLCVTNVYSGISKHGGKFACHLCEGESTTECGKLRTFRSLADHHAAYTAAGSKPAKMQKFKNVINKCLIKAEPDVLVSDVLPLPELHLLLGVCTHFFKVMLKLWPQLAMWGRGKWTVHGRHGGGLDGANSMKFLRNLDLLLTIIPTKLKPIIYTLKQFKCIVEGCFGWNLCSDYRQQIRGFTSSLKKLQLYCQVSYQ